MNCPVCKTAMVNEPPDYVLKNPLACICEQCSHYLCPKCGANKRIGDCNQYRPQINELQRLANKQRKQNMKES